MAAVGALVGPNDQPGTPHAQSVIHELYVERMTQEHFEPDPEEAARMASHQGPDGPVSAVYRWLELLADGDFTGAWARMDDNLRLCRAQAWLWANRHHDDIAALDLEAAAERLSSMQSSSSALWGSFASTELHQLFETWGPRFEQLESGSLASASATRIVGPDLEVIVLTESAEAWVAKGPTLLTNVFVFTVRMTANDWKIAAYGDCVPIPGWPPVLEPPLD